MQHRKNTERCESTEQGKSPEVSQIAFLEKRSLNQKAKALARWKMGSRDVQAEGISLEEVLW